MAGATANLHIAKNYKIGNTRVKIADDFCVKTKAEIDAILADIAKLYLNSRARTGKL